jgi:hypothetical protein
VARRPSADRKRYGADGGVGLFSGWGLQRRPTGRAPVSVPLGLIVRCMARWKIVGGPREYERAKEILDAWLRAP